MVDNAGTLTAAENAVLEHLRTHGPSPTGPGTYAKVVSLGGRTRSVHQVDTVTVRRLAKAGYVTVDAGAVAHLTAKAGP